MAVYPCDYGRHRYPQPQQSIYYTHVIGSSCQTYKMRLCPQHFELSCEQIAEYLSLVDENSQIDKNCTRCDAEAAGSLYAKVFRAKQEGEQWAGDFCAGCLSGVANHLRIFNVEPM